MSKMAEHIHDIEHEQAADEAATNDHCQQDICCGDDSPLCTYYIAPKADNLAADACVARTAHYAPAPTDPAADLADMLIGAIRRNEVLSALLGHFDAAGVNAIIDYLACYRAHAEAGQRIAQHVHARMETMEPHTEAVATVSITQSDDAAGIGSLREAPNDVAPDTVCYSDNVSDTYCDKDLDEGNIIWTMDPDSGVTCPDCLREMAQDEVGVNRQRKLLSLGPIKVPDDVDARLETVLTGYSAHQLREDIRAIMRAGGEAPPDIAERTWWPADLVREITEWHEAGRPTPDPAKTF